MFLEKYIALLQCFVLKFGRDVLHTIRKYDSHTKEMLKIGAEIERQESNSFNRMH